MKTTLPLCALLALSMFGVHRWELARLQADLAAAREDVRLTEQRRVPKAELAKARAAVAAVEGKVAALEHELTTTRGQLAASQEAARAAGPASSAKVAEAAAPTGLVKGSFTVMDDTKVYSPDAQLKVGDSVLISSPTGMMLSDKEVDLVAGDLAVETPGGKMQATHAFIDVNDGKIEMTADSVSFTNK